MPPQPNSKYSKNLQDEYVREIFFFNVVPTLVRTGFGVQDVGFIGFGATCRAFFCRGLRVELRVDTLCLLHRPSYSQGQVSLNPS